MNEVFASIYPALLLSIFVGFWHHIFKIEEKINWLTVFIWNSILCMIIAIPFKGLAFENIGANLEGFYRSIYHIFFTFSMLSLVWALILAIKKIK